MSAIETLISVLCGPDGKCCISGSDDDRRLIDAALAELARASPTAQAAESVPAVMSGDELVRLGKSPESGLYPWGIGTTRADYLRAVRAVLAAARAPADSVLEDAARYRWLRRWKGQEHEPPFTVQHEIDGTLWGGDLDAAIDTARKQGANHDKT